QHIVSSAAESGTTCCADGRWRCVGGEEDPGLTEIGSQREKIRIITLQAITFAASSIQESRAKSNSKRTISSLL
ncbi:hypothetical protein, partial [Escherichia coli]